MRRIFARSNKAKDCREVVTSYNAARGSIEEEETSEEVNGYEENEYDVEQHQCTGVNLKWGAFAVEEEDERCTIAAPEPVPKKQKAAIRKRPLTAAAEIEEEDVRLCQRFDPARDSSSIEENSKHREPLAAQKTNHQTVIASETVCQPNAGMHIGQINGIPPPDAAEAVVAGMAAQGRRGSGSHGTERDEAAAASGGRKWEGFVHDNGDW